MERVFVGGIIGKLDSGSISSCQIASSTVYSNLEVGGICGRLPGSGYLISRCYVYNSTVEGIGNYVGIILGREYSSNTVSNNFTDITGKLVGSGPSSNCYNSVTDFTTFSGKAWSDGLPYNDENSVWKNYNISETTWPPDLKALPRQ